MKLLLVLLFLQVVLGDLPSTSQPLGESDARPTTEIERNNVVAKELRFIKHLKLENSNLRQVKQNLKKECDDRMAKWAIEYNTMLSKIKRDLPDIKGLEKKLTNALLKDEALKKALREMNRVVSLLKLKKFIMEGDIHLLQKRQGQDYELCQEFSSYIGFQPEGGIATRSLGNIAVRDLPLINSASDMSRVLFERKKVWLDIKRDQETFQNIELKKFISYYSGYCQRRIANIKQLIEDLRAYPQGGAGLERLREELAKVEREIEATYRELRPLQEELDPLIREVKRLQVQYDELEDEANCFLKLDQWHIDGSMASLKDLINQTDNLNYGRELLGSDTQPRSLEVDTNDVSTDSNEMNEADNSSGETRFKKIEGKATKADTPSDSATLKPVTIHVGNSTKAGTPSATVTHNPTAGHEEPTHKPVSVSGGTTHEVTTVKPTSKHPK